MRALLLVLPCLAASPAFAHPHDALLWGKLRTGMTVEEVRRLYPQAQPMVMVSAFGERREPSKIYLGRHRTAGLSAEVRAELRDGRVRSVDLRLMPPRRRKLTRANLDRLLAETAVAFGPPVHCATASTWEGMVLNVGFQHVRETTFVAVGFGQLMGEPRLTMSFSEASDWWRSHVHRGPVSCPYPGESMPRDATGAILRPDNDGPPLPILPTLPRRPSPADPEHRASPIAP